MSHIIYPVLRSLTSVVSTLIGSVYFSVAVPSGKKKQMWRPFLFWVKKNLLYVFANVFFGYQVLTAVLQTWTQPPQSAPLVLLPLHKSHSDEIVLCQSNHSVALCPECPSVPYLVQKQCDSKKTKQWLNDIHLLLINYSNVFLWWDQEPQKYLHVVPATALSRPSSSSHRCSDASSYCSVNLQVTQEGKYTIWWFIIDHVLISKWSYSQVVTIIYRTYLIL